MHKIILLVLLSTFSFISPSSACGINSDCNVSDDRHYRVRLPDGYKQNTKIGAIFFAHGLGGTAQGVAKNQNLARIANNLNVALIALKSKHDDWNIKNSPNGRSDRSSNEYDYLDDVIDDLRDRFKIDEKNIILAGVSVGGTMTWTMACTGRGRFAAYMPISGTYWLKPPKHCATRPANIIHVHGKSDKTVPLTGRRVGSSAHSNVYKVIESYSKIGRYKKTGTIDNEDLKCSIRKNSRQKILEFCLHNGGHWFRAKDIEYAWNRFKSLGVLQDMQ